MAFWRKSRPPRLEIADLGIQESDPRYAGAVRCARTYWKQATRLTSEQRKRFLGFLKTGSKVDYLSKPLKVTAHILYTSARNYLGEIPTDNIRWADYLFLSSLYERLPEDYIAVVTERYCTTAITDYTDEYRSYHPEPTASGQENIPKSIQTSQPINIDLTQNEEISNNQQTAFRAPKRRRPVPTVPNRKQKATSIQKKSIVIEKSTGKERQDIAAKKVKENEVRASTSHQQDNTPTEKTSIVIGKSTGIQQQGAMPAQKECNVAPTSTSQNENNTAAGTQLLTASPTTTEPVEEEIWNISNIVGILSLQNKKRLCSAPESAPKRVKLIDGNEILDKVNQQAETIQQALEKFSYKQGNQDIKLQEVRDAVEQNKQTLDKLQSELRQFMSAVATTLRNIQERLDE